ncbi:MAG: beta-lactamase family protein [Bacteroidales bacterium]|nr:beta-lactamase family protein [Bacteroidales bacterium]
MKQLKKALCIAGMLLAVSALCRGLAGCENKEKAMEQKQAAFEDSLLAIIREANIPMIQLKYTEPSDSVYCQVGVTPWSTEKPVETDSAAVGEEAWKQMKFSYRETGKADYEKEAVFQAASLSKVVFAYIVLKMYDNGEIDIDRPLYEYTDIDRFVDKDMAKTLTARLILMHRSGIDDWAASPSSDEWPTAPIKFTFPVDSIFGYSGEGYAFLQRAVEAIKGKDIQSIAKEYVFEPLDMPLSAYEWIPEFEGITTASVRRNGESQGVRQFPRQNVAYTLRTCANDYSNFIRAIMDGKGLSQASHALMITPCSGPATQFPPKVRPVDEKQSIFWGLGIGIEENKNYGRVLWHWGDNGNTKALFVIIPSQKKTLVYFANSGAGHDITNKVLDLFFKDGPMDIQDWIQQE